MPVPPVRIPTPPEPWVSDARAVAARLHVVPALVPRVPDALPPKRVPEPVPGPRGTGSRGGGHGQVLALLMFALGAALSLGVVVVAGTAP